MSISSPKSKITLFILVFLTVVTFAISAQAAVYSTANLNNESKKSGINVNVHTGSTIFSAYNGGTSKWVLTGAIRRFILIFPDTQVYTQYFQPGHGVSKAVSLSPSTYYAYAEAGGNITANVSIRGNSIP